MKTTAAAVDVVLRGVKRKIYECTKETEITALDLVEGQVNLDI